MENKKIPSSYETDEIENLIGVCIPNRNKFVNSGELCSKNIYAGFAIGKVFAEDQDRLFFELDAVFLHFLWVELSKLGVSDNQVEDALYAVFDNFELSKNEIQKFERRLKGYNSAEHAIIAEKFIKNLDVSDLPDNFKEPASRILGDQFEAISKLIAKVARNELGAST